MNSFFYTPLIAICLLVFTFFTKNHTLDAHKRILNYEVTICSPNISYYYFFSPVRISSKGNSLPINMLLDNKGELLYFKPFQKGPYAGSFRLQVNGKLSYYFDSKFFIMDSTFKIIDSISCQNKIEQDSHEFLILPNGNYLLIGNETTMMDLSSYPYFLKRNVYGSKRARVTCNVIQELNTKKQVVFEWHAKDHFQFSDVDPVFLNDTSTVDWMHFNSLDQDEKGNILVSIRNFNEVSKIRKADGKILWRFGGKNNQFICKNDTALFKGQHDVRKNQSGTLTLFDNGRTGNPFHPEAAKEYSLNEKTKKASLVWSHMNNSLACSSGYGSVFRSSDGNTLINYGRSDNANVVFNVISPKGEKLFELVSSDSIRNYRTYMYSSLPFQIKRPGISLKVINKHVYLEAEEGHASYLWSNGETERVIEIKKTGLYKVYVPIGDGGFLVSKPFSAQATEIE